MIVSEKIKAIRTAEGLSQNQFCKIMEISISTLKKLEGGYNEPGWATLMKLTQHPLFEKYTLWLMTNKTAPESGQIAPSLSLDGPETTPTSRRSTRKIG
ncbi:helix-turn-helix domain-containing protein [Yersinia enterocolitica]|uniref:helix-turn-helix domain-containing protein n=1 Tax=Yersinia enterocolitica TaxID=630 RepID=UPI001C60C7CA|nr:helix-turn-helix transcriptional regulator [Yersinia enterocolitica]MBW5852223.1 helix-turn-helix transcriptional regulator [Yersinia enterocolitica]MDN0099764.1 helix-turn-helix transcriptional regulator [Yersinia enterocolitica]HDL7645903.1 helix-turn-helix transcriptional regulator [Yersinia enterocolitica]HEI6814621.1 helix-turn-helix transcriptional regulator [Yersinia enterocolitica]